MKTTTIGFWVVFAAVAMESRGAVAQNCSDEQGSSSAAFTNCCGPLWTATAGSILLNRSTARPGSLVFDGTTDVELSNVADFDLGWAAGAQIELTRHFNSGWDIGLRYFGIDGWNASDRLDDPGNLRVPMVSSDPDDFFDTASASYRSRLYNAEINLERQLGKRLRVLAGFRYVELLEQISSSAYSPTLEGVFDIGSSNYLYGFQMGAEAIVFEYGKLQVDSFLKAGVYGNHIRGSIYGDGTYFHIEDSATASRTSFLGEIGLSAKYRLGSHCAVFGGYQLMWLQGVALAGDFVSSLVNYSEDFDVLDGAAFYHGAQVGLEFTW